MYAMSLSPNSAVMRVRYSVRNSWSMLMPSRYRRVEPSGMATVDTTSAAGDR